MVSEQTHDNLSKLTDVLPLTMPDAMRLVLDTTASSVLEMHLLLAQTISDFLAQAPRQVLGKVEDYCRATGRSLPEAVVDCAGHGAEMFAKSRYQIEDGADGNARPGWPTRRQAG